MNDLISKSNLIKKIDDISIQINFKLPVKEILGQYVDEDDFIMLMQDAIREYKKKVIKTIGAQEKIYSIEQLKEIDKLYLDKCEEVNALKYYIQKLEKEKQESGSCAFKEECRQQFEKENEEALVQGVEFGLDNNLNVDLEDIEKYKEITSRK